MIVRRKGGRKDQQRLVQQEKREEHFGLKSEENQKKVVEGKFSPHVRVSIELVANYSVFNVGPKLKATPQMGKTPEELSSYASTSAPESTKHDAKLNQWLRDSRYYPLTVVQ